MAYYHEQPLINPTQLIFKLSKKIKYTLFLNGIWTFLDGSEIMVWGMQSSSEKCSLKRRTERTLMLGTSEDKKHQTQNKIVGGLD